MKQIPINLASNPVEQQQWLRRVKRATVGGAVALTALHLLLFWTLPAPPPNAEAADREAILPLRAWSAEVADTLTAADPRAAQRVALSVEVANALIDRRAFPWGRLFFALEQVLPDDVMLEIVQPVVTADGVRVTLTAVSANSEALRGFLSALEGRPEFHSVFPGRQSVGLDGNLRLSVEALAWGGRQDPDGGGQP